MKEYRRKNPLFSLCGLNCGLCPRYYTKGKSKCPGCGGKEFHLLHPSCPVITCSKKHDEVEYCFHCGSFPCGRYEPPAEKDSFITYRNVIKDMQKAKEIGVIRYQQELNEKIAFLEYLLEHYDDGKRKNFYCIAVNLLEPSDLNELKEKISCTAQKDTAISENLAKQVVLYILKIAERRGVDVKLRK